MPYASVSPSPDSSRVVRDHGIVAGGLTGVKDGWRGLSYVEGVCVVKLKRDWTYIMAAPIRFGMEKNNPAIGILSTRLAANPNAIKSASSQIPQERRR